MLMGCDEKLLTTLESMILHSHPLHDEARRWRRVMFYESCDRVVRIWNFSKLVLEKEFASQRNETHGRED